MTILYSIQKRVAHALPGGRYWCCLCTRDVRRFLPYRGGNGGRSDFIRAMDVVGSDVDNFECPHCGGHDRERHLVLYMRGTQLVDEFAGASVLHFAPELHVATIIEGARPARYTKADLFPGSADIEKLDILDLPYPDESFDFLIANHVLEHVADDLRALAEVRRVLKIGGHAILQTPYSSRLTVTWQDAGINTKFARRIAFGQEDHVRLYGRDIFERFASAGLEPLVSDHETLLADVDATRFGVNAREPFFLFRRPGGPELPS
jgi:SAM-dependent methyltransferase